MSGIEEMVQDWRLDFTNALGRLAIAKAQEGSERASAYEASERALHQVLERLKEVVDVESAVHAADCLRADMEALGSDWGGHILEKALVLLDDHIVNPFEPDPERSAWDNAVTLVRLRTPEHNWAEIRVGLENDSKEFKAQQHFGIGMAIRNILRRAGYDESVLGVDSLDGIWDKILRAAVSPKPSSGPIPLDRVFKVAISPPALPDLDLERRWGFVANTGNPATQFVLYRTQEGFHLVQEDAVGKQTVMTDGTVAGVYARITDAYEVVVGWLTALLEGSHHVSGPSTTMTIVDTTDEQTCLEISTLWLDDGRVWEKRGLDPETYETLSQSG